MVSVLTATSHAHHAHPEAGVIVAKQMRCVRAGDMVLCGDGEFRAVECMVVTPIPTPTTTYYNMGSTTGRPVLLTAYHPVWWDGRWAFPVDVGCALELPTEAHYNVLMGQGATDIVVEGVRCITLAHGIASSTVAQHDYLGTHRVRDDIRAMRGYATGGRVVLDANRCVRDPVTMKIVKWVEEE